MKILDKYTFGDLTLKLQSNLDGFGVNLINLLGAMYNASDVKFTTPRAFEKKSSTVVKTLQPTTTLVL
jgi:hypothetical protein